MSLPTGQAQTLEHYTDIDRRFRLILWITLGIFVISGAAVGLVRVPPPKEADITELPPRMAKLIIPKKVEEKPKEPDKPEEVELEPEEEAVEEKVPEEVPTPPSPEEAADQRRKEDMKVAMNTGLLKILRRAPKKDDSRMSRALSQIGGLKSGPGSGRSRIQTARSSRGIDDIVSRLERSIGALKPIGGDTESGGITSQKLQADLGDTKLKDREITALENPFTMDSSIAGGDVRDMQDIAEVVDSYKGGISLVYNRALRKNPTLRGTITVEFIISALGDVIECKVVSSSMNNAAFEESIVKRVRHWKFSAISAGDVKITYPIVFSVGG